MPEVNPTAFRRVSDTAKPQKTIVHLPDIREANSDKREVQTVSVNLNEKLSQFDTHWAPRIIASYNDSDVMLAKLSGEFHWHSHSDTDDFFLVVEGEVEIDLPDKTISLKPGELFVVPAGVEHRPRAITPEAAVLLIEPKGTPNTGDPETAAPKPTL